MPAADDTPRLRVLVAEDNADCADVLALLLRADGYYVAIARDGAAAVEKARTFRPDVVLLDLGLTGMSGYEVARRLAGPGRPFLVALTGYGDEGSRRLSSEAGIDLHLLKPVERELLRAILERCRAGMAGTRPAATRTS